MSSVTAELKCPYGRGKDLIEPEAVTEVASHRDGGGWEDPLEGGSEGKKLRASYSGL
jgi:hypothetical protein